MNGQPEPVTLNADLKSRNLLGAAFLLLFAFLGFHGVLLEDEQWSDLAISLGVQLTATGYCIRDMRLIGRPLPRLSEWLVFLTWPVSVPVLLLRSHWKRNTLRTFGLLVLAALAYGMGCGWALALLGLTGQWVITP